MARGGQTAAMGVNSHAVLRALSRPGALASADAAMAAVCMECEGMSIVIPSPLWWKGERDREERNKRIRQEFDGTSRSVGALARKHGLSTRQIRRILNPKA